MYSSRPHHSAFDELVALALVDTPTERLPVVRLSRSPRDTEPMLLPVDSIDSMGRFYLSYNGQPVYEYEKHRTMTYGQFIWYDTLYHVERLVKRYRDQIGLYPEEICISLQRELARGQYLARKYWPRDMLARPIPFRWEPDNVGQYEILVRGKLS